jgi:shikimate kinase
MPPAQRHGEQSRTRRHIVVLGMMGAGKTTVADQLGTRLGRPHRDSDRDIEKITGRTGRQIADEDGVDKLHSLEEVVLLDALASMQPSVISGAGWVIESSRCREAMQRESTIVWLRISAADLRTRVGQGSHRRDLSAAELDQLLLRREPLLLELADIIVDARRTPADIVDDLALQV